MTEVEKIREEVVRLKSQLLRGACSSQIAMETRCKEEAYDEVLTLLDSLQEEPVSEDLEEAALQFTIERSQIDNGGIWCTSDIGAAFKAGANWQKEQDQETIELAEDHAMLAGMEKMKEEMMAKAIDATIGLSYENKTGRYTHIMYASRPLPVGNNKIAIIFKEDWI